MIRTALFFLYGLAAVAAAQDYKINVGASAGFYVCEPPAPFANATSIVVQVLLAGANGVKDNPNTPDISVPGGDDIVVSEKQFSLQETGGSIWADFSGLDASIPPISNYFYVRVFRRSSPAQPITWFDTPLQSATYTYPLELPRATEVNTDLRFGDSLEQNTSLIGPGIPSACADPIAEIAASSQDVFVSVATLHNCLYQLQYFAGGSTWSNVGSALGPTGTITTVIDSGAVSAKRQYRVVITGTP